MSRLVLFLVCALSLSAQNGPHWGIQADYSVGVVPDFIVDQFNDLVEKPQIDAKTYNAGIVRFHGNGSPSWAIEFTKTQLNLEGSLQTGPVRQELRGNGWIRGAMATKYTNFFSNRYFSAGLAFGGGVGKLEANYYRFVV